MAALQVTLLAAWLGAAILVAAVVAPAAFRVLPSRTMAGALVGQVLPVIFIAGMVIGGIAALLESRASAGRFQLTVAAPFVLMILACIVAQFVIGPKIEAVRASIGGAVESLAVADPRRVRFGRLHGISVLFMGVAMLGAGWALVQKHLRP